MKYKEARTPQQELRTSFTKKLPEKGIFCYCNCIWYCPSLASGKFKEEEKNV